VLVIGLGITGMSAAIEAHTAGARVIVLDKCPSMNNKLPAGNSWKASSGMSATGTDAQNNAGVHDSADKLFDDIVASGKGHSDQVLARILAEHSLTSWEWLKAQGVPLEAVAHCGGHSQNRTHRPAKGPPTGMSICMALQKKLSHIKHRLKIHTAAKVTQIEPIGPSTAQPNGYILKALQAQQAKGSPAYLETAIAQAQGQPARLRVHFSLTDDQGEVQEQSEDVTSVVLATGGYCFAAKNPDGSPVADTTLFKYAPDVVGYPTTSGDQATGDGVGLALGLGAGLRHMDMVQVHPTGFVDPKNPGNNSKFLGPELLRGVGALLINQKGERFTNELGLRDEITAEIVAKCDNKTSYLVMSGEAAAAFSAPDEFEKHPYYKGFGPKVGPFFEKFDNVASFEASVESIPEGAVATTLSQYAQSAETKKPDQWGKTRFPSPPAPDCSVYVAQITPSVHYCMGGVSINGFAQMLGEEGLPIKGVWAAGEVAGGLHGANRLVGNSLLETVVFGRIAGVGAAEL